MEDGLTALQQRWLTIGLVLCALMAVAIFAPVLLEFGHARWQKFKAQREARKEAAGEQAEAELDVEVTP